MGTGNFRGTGIVGAIEHFVQRYGPAAANDVVAKMPAQHRELLKPNAPAIGLLPTRLYSYAFVGELVRTMAKVVRAPDEDAFIREITWAGIDAGLGTVNRMLLRWVAPQDHANRAQEIWTHYHDAGLIKILSVTDHEYAVQISDWPGHDVTVCKVCLEGRARVLSKSGITFRDYRREKCQTWGHDVCVYRYRW